MTRQEYGSNDSQSRYKIILDAYPSNYSAAGNWTTISFGLWAADNNGSYSGNGPLSWSMNVGGYAFDGYLSSFYANSGATLKDWDSRTFSHDANGGLGVYASASASGDGGPLGSASGGFWVEGIQNFYRGPNTPSFTSITRSADGTSFSVAYAASGAANSGPGVTYEIIRAQNAAMTVDRQVVGTTNTVNANTTYYFQMRAYNSDGDVYGSVLGPYYGVPGVPTGLSATPSPNVQNRVSLAWAAPSYTGSGITNYKVYRDDTYLGETGSSTASYIDNSATRGTTFTYKIQAINSVGANGFSGTATGTGPGVPYAAVLNSAVASTDTFGKVSLSWTAPTTSVGTIQNYYMYAVYNSVIEKTVSTGTNVTSGIITGLDERKVYTFYVRARNQFSVDNSVPGDVSNTIDRKSPGPPSAPTALTSNAPYIPPGTVDLSWTAPSDVGTEGGVITGYTIYLAGNPTPLKTTTGTAVTTTITDLIPATSYTFYVRARNALADTVGTFSVASNSTTATAQGEPFAPTNFQVLPDPVVAGRLVLTWTPPAGYNTGFRVYDASNAVIANIAVPRLEIDGLTTNSSYSYRVRARNPLTDQTGSEGGALSAAVAGVVGGTSTQTVPSVVVNNTTNSALVGTYNVLGGTATTFNYSKTAANIPFASVPVDGGATLNNTNTNLNGVYTVNAVGAQGTSTAITYSRAGADIALNTSTPSGTMYNNTNVIFNGNYTVLDNPAPDTVTHALSYTKVHGSNISSRAASGLITNNSNAIYNGEYVLTGVTETSMSYSKTNADIAASDAFGFAYDKTNIDVFNGTYAIIDIPDHKTVSYVTNDLVYGENLITNPSFEFVQSGTDVIRANLVTNPSFDTNVTGWTTSNSTIARSALYSHLGTHSALVSPTSSSGGISATATTVSGSPYRLSAWLYAEAQTTVRLSITSPSITGATTTIPADTWTRVSLPSFNANTASTTLSVESVGSVQPFFVDGVLLEQTTELRPYFDGATADALGWDYGWSGTAHASTSTAKALAVVGSATPVGVTSVSATVQTKYTYAHSGGVSTLITPSINAGGASITQITVAGASYVFSIWVYTTVAKNIRLSADSTAGSPISVPANVWTRLSLSFTAEDASTLLSILGTDSTQSFYIDDMMLQESSTLQPYFDGDTDASAVTWPVVYSWAETPHDSVSIREVGATLPDIGSELLPPYGTALRQQSEAHLQIRYRSGWLG